MTGSTTSGTAPAFVEISNGIRVRIRLTPNASREEIGGLVETPDGQALTARVTAIPEAGRANEALRKLVAKTLGVAKSNVELIAGTKSRVKTFAVGGDPVTLGRMLREL